MKYCTNFLSLTLLALLTIGLVSCASSSKEEADVVFINGDFYTVQDRDQSRVAALAIKDGRILAMGDEADLAPFRSDSTKVIDLNGAFAMPGFIEGHGHFSGLGASLMNLNFLKSRSWDEIVQMVATKAAETEEGAWITGRGWHQEKWDDSPLENVHGYPHHHELSALTEDHPVMLRHASGHSLYANAVAMELAGVTAETPDPQGGHIVRDSRGEPIGVFEERAMKLITDAYRVYVEGLSQDDLQAEWLRGVGLAQEECLAKGITSFQDAGSNPEEIADYTSLAERGELNLRLWAMLRHYGQGARPIIEGIPATLPIIDAGNYFFTCRAIKSEVDGALGAFGAWLLEPYNDKPDFVGQNTTLVESVDSIAQVAIENDLQLCVHAIGDRANQEVLDLMEATFAAHPDKTDLRWRIEHSQHLHPDDIPRFGELGVIASMQAIHCTSDAPFVVSRLGEQRAREGAYPWRSLLDAGAVVTNGTDAPVENVDPIASFYASVTRKRPGEPEPFFAEQAMTRAEAIYSYTMAPAYAAFEEQDKGSLEVGKLADIVVLSHDLLECTDEEILDTQVLMTIVGGEVKFEKGQ